jgi:enterochelin esterase family protein
MAHIQSEHIGSFEVASGTDPTGALAALRAELEAAGGPLVEAIGGRERTVLVSFVWIGEEGPVSVQTPLLPGAPRSTPLTRIAGTDVWHVGVLTRADVTTTYRFLVGDPFLEIDADNLARHREEALRLEQQLGERAFADPFNPDAIPFGTALPRERWLSVLTLPAAEPMRWYEDDGASTGTLEQLAFTSGRLDNERQLTVYLPPGYDGDDDPYALVVMLDGEMWVNPEYPQHLVFDNLIAARRIPPVVVAFVDNAPSELPPGMTRAFELNCNPDFVAMLADELLPFLHSRYRIASEPDWVVIAGPSFGGLASAWIGFERPEAFGNVLACSPAVWWGYASDDERFILDEHGLAMWLTGEREEPEWLTRRYAAGERKPLRIWVDVGTLEISPMFDTPAPGLDYRTAVRHLRDVLTAKGYDLTYHEAPGGHDWPTFRRSYAKGLQELLGDR